MVQTNIAFDPDRQSMHSLVARCKEDWGKPEENRELLLPTGILPLDMALYGLDRINGEIVLFQGPEKQRKSTTVENIVDHFMWNPKVIDKPLTVIDSLESGMPPERYRDQLISIRASKILMDAGHRVHEACQVCGTPTCKELAINPEFLRFRPRTPAQAAAIEQALEECATWPLQIYGANEKEGETRNLVASVVGQPDLKSRWQYLIEYYGAKVFVIDHIQQYSFAGMDMGDYEKQLRTIAAVSDIVARYKVVCLMISQVSLSSQRDAAAGIGKYNATGGRKAAAEATSIISVNYESGGGKVCITLEDSRKAPSFSVYQPLEDSSGAFFGEAAQAPKAAFRPGMEDRSYGRGK